jgi:methionine-rich copper-binding protein CopC
MPGLVRRTVALHRHVYARTALAAALVLFLAGAAAGHAYLRAADPAEDSVVRAAPDSVKLSFTEPVEVRFSTFKVYRLAADPGWDQRRLNAAGGALVSDVLQKRGDEADRADDGVVTAARTSASIVLRLKGSLRPGSFVVMYRVLSIDTHTTQGFYVFTFAPR